MKRSLVYGIFVWLLMVPGAFALNLGSYNIRYDNPSDVRDGNGWSQRVGVIASLIRFHDFDVLGTQEGLPHQMKDLRKLLPEHQCVSYGRDDGKDAGEHIAIFYKRDRFELLDSGLFWLSETPERPGKGWDADLPRICTWAKLRERSSSVNFYFFNVHLDHRGKQARRNGVDLILRKIGELAGGEPVVLTGDFNADQTSDVYRRIVDSGQLDDAAETAEIAYLLNGTANGFKPNGETSSRIDHVFLSSGTRVLRYGVLTDSYRIASREPIVGDHSESNFPAEVKFQDHEARLPSDHFPVLVETSHP